MWIFIKTFIMLRPPGRYGTSKLSSWVIWYWFAMIRVASSGFLVSPPTSNLPVYRYFRMNLNPVGEDSEVGHVALVFQGRSGQQCIFCPPPGTSLCTARYFKMNLKPVGEVWSSTLETKPVGQTLVRRFWFVKQSRWTAPEKSVSQYSRWQSHFWWGPSPSWQLARPQPLLWWWLQKHTCPTASRLFWLVPSSKKAWKVKVDAVSYSFMFLAHANYKIPPLSAHGCQGS